MFCLMYILTCIAFSVLGLNNKEEKDEGSNESKSQFIELNKQIDSTTITSTTSSYDTHTTLAQKPNSDYDKKHKNDDDEGGGFNFFTGIYLHFWLYLLFIYQIYTMNSKYMNKCDFLDVLLPIFLVGAAIVGFLILCGCCCSDDDSSSSSTAVADSSEYILIRVT
ncbi:MAG: hypothetical protein EZS28_021121 [Streblomastix strix]|uniref:Dolichol phosphate-mannose biosynthesis regulatory protein n=1 Tax=Streblomastix strix TaxID=222440 RepID=A0A5J4VL95_9EUKA|nr:MAG: hypothetical protein EZS28_021121 [Streblomastix strix]